MELRSKIGLSILCSILLWTSCKKDNNFPDEPVVKFESFEIDYDPPEESIADTIIELRISFTDGDGDLGSLIPCAPPEAEDVIFIDYFELIDGEWVEIESGATLDRCLDNLTPEGQDKTLEGNIALRLGLPFRQSEHNDSIRYSISLRDRAGHLSEPAFTELIVP